MKPECPSLDESDLAAPAERAVIDGEYAIHLIGVGGTGVVTEAHLLAVAALFDGKKVSELNRTGLAQKGGPVESPIVLGEGVVPPSSLYSRRAVRSLPGGRYRRCGEPPEPSGRLRAPDRGRGEPVRRPDRADGVRPPGARRRRPGHGSADPSPHPVGGQYLHRRAGLRDEALREPHRGQRVSPGCRLPGRAHPPCRPGV